jgi:hypothetical protein
VRVEVSTKANYLYGKKEKDDKEEGQEVEGQETPLVFLGTVPPKGGTVFVWGRRV